MPKNITNWVSRNYLLKQNLEMENLVSLNEPDTKVQHSYLFPLLVLAKKKTKKKQQTVGVITPLKRAKQSISLEH